MSKKFFAIFCLAMLLVACGGSEVADIESSLPVEVEVEADVEAEEVELTNTPLPPPTETPIPPTATSIPPTETPIPPSPTPVPPPPTAEPEPTETESAAVDEEPVVVEASIDMSGVVPELVWLPYGAGSYGFPVFTIDEGTITFIQEPTIIEAFFDYNAQYGLMAFSTQFWSAAENGRDSVSDIWVHDFSTGEEVAWHGGNIGRAAWARHEARAPLLAVAVHNGEQFDLALMSGPDELEIIDTGIRPYFSWSPTEAKVAYAQGETIKIYDVESSSIIETAAQGFDYDFGWVGDKPLWDPAGEFLIYPSQPFTFVPTTADGEPFIPVNLDDSPLEESRPTSMLWSAELRQLIVQTEGFTENVQIYLLSEDLRYVTDTYFLENSNLIDWYEDGASIVIYDIDRQPKVWSLADYLFIDVEVIQPES